eukprot:3937305-Rhodomonas_salina.7
MDERDAWTRWTGRGARSEERGEEQRWRPSGLGSTLLRLESRRATLNERIMPGYTECVEA